MTNQGIDLQPGVEISRLVDGYRVTDRATALRLELTCAPRLRDTEALAWPEIEVFLLANGLARADQSRARRVLDAAGVNDRTKRRQMLRWSAARRVITDYPTPLLFAVVVTALCRAWGVLLLLASAAGAGFAAVLQISPAGVIDFGAAPGLFVCLVAVHETAHWVAVRRVNGNEAGAFLLGPGVCCVVRPPSNGSEIRAIALAGPVAGALGSIAAIAAFHSSVVLLTVAAVLVTVNLLGFTPISGDGRDFWRSSDSPSSEQ